MIKLLKKRPALAVMGIILFIGAVLSVLFICHRYMPGRKWAQFSEVYDVSEGKAAVFYNNEWIGSDAFISDSRAYVSLDTITGYVNAGFYYNDENKLIYVLPLSLVKADEGENCYEINGMITETDYQVFKVVDGTVYLCMDFVMEFTNISEDIFSEPDRIVINSLPRNYTSAVMKRDAYVRRYAGIKSLIICKAVRGEEVEVIDSVDNWIKVRTSEGYIGYIKSKDITGRTQLEEAGKTFDYEYTSVRKDYKECVAWHQVFNQEANGSLEEYIKDSKGLTVISPTWFSLTDNEGNFSSLADHEYIEKAHESGLEVWALIDDFDTSLDLKALFYSTKARQNLISGLMSAYTEYGFDGINIDFEKIDEETAPDYLEFLRELSIECRKNSIVLSVDNYVVAGGRSWYNISEQGRIADYVVMMGYDEHWKGGEPGSNASLSFTRNGVADAVKQVEPEKIIYALPFFMRVWTEVPEESAEEGSVIYDDENSHYGRYAVTSEAIGMAKGKSLLQDNHASVEWNDDLGQYYGEYEQDGTFNRIWLEDAESLKKKLDVISEYDIGGVSFWKLGLETDDVWDVIVSYLKS